MKRASLFRLSPLLALALLLGALALFHAAPAEAQSPAAPTNLTVSAGIDTGELYLLWTAPSGTLTGYDVHYTSAPATGAGAVADSAAASGADPAAAWVAGTRTATQTTTAAHSFFSLIDGTTYRVRVRAVNSGANSAWVFGTGIPGAVWTATLTADQSGIFVGCNNDGPTQDSCSSATVLTEDEFRHGTATYTVVRVDWRSNINGLDFEIAGPGNASLTGQQIKTALSGLTLNVDGTALAVSDAIATNATLYWTFNPDTDWTDGQTVKLTLRTAAQQVKAPSSDATLHDLQATSSTSASGTSSALTLSPSFAATTTAYTASVLNAVTHVKLRPLSHFNATVEVGLQGQTLTAVTSGIASGPIELSVGANVITVKVTAQDRDFTKTYTVTVTRAQPSTNAALSGLTATQAESASGTFGALTLSPSFAASTTAYTASVGNSITHLKLRPTASNSYATVEVGQGSSLAAVTSGQESGPIALSLGANAITVKVTAEDGSNTNTYTVTVTRAMAEPSGAPPASATGTEGTLVSNTGQTHQTVSNFENRVHAQAFTTGPYVDGYTLTSIDAILRTDAGITSEDAATVRAELWSDSNGTPGSRLAYMTARNIPTGTPGIYTVAFAPSYGIPTTLAANTTYHFVIYTTGSPADLDVQVTRSATDDAGAAEGWSIADQRSSYGQNTPPWAPAWTTATNAFVQITVKGQPVSITLWSSTLTVKDLGPLAGDGCIGNLQCSARFSSGNIFFYGGWVYDVVTLKVRNGSLQLLLDKELPLHVDQVRLDVGGKQFQFKDAMETWGIERDEDALLLTWHGTGLSWSDGDEVSVSLVGRNMPAPATPAPHTGLHPVRVHYDEMRDGEPVDNFNNLRLAQPKPSTIPGTSERRVELRAYIPGTFHSIDPDKGMVTTTHVMLRVRAHPASALEWAIGNVYGVTGAFAAFANGGFTPAIALNPASKWTYIYVRVTNGTQTATHLVAIDPPPRTYTLTPKAQVAEGEEAALSLSLGSPAGAGGVSFTVAADYPDGGATAEDVGEIAASVTVPEGQQSARIIIPTVDDEAVEAAEERFTVRVAHAGEPAWAVDPEGTDAAVVTIVDNDEPPPPEGPEPWNIRVVPGDGTLTVTWNVSSRDGVEDSEIWHVLRWSQEPGVWANPRDPRAVSRSDGLSVDPGLTGYTITGLKNGVATGVFIRSMVGHRNNMSELEGNSSKWVRVKGEHTTPVAPPNAAPTVSAAIADATIVNESGTHGIPLTGVFDDGDGDELTITATSSDDAVATVSVSADYSTLTVTAQCRGRVTITVNASDGNGGTVDDSFAVTVKAAPVVASAIADVSGLEAGDSRAVSLSGVFSDPDGDALTITASSSDEGKATVSVASDQSALTVSAVAEGAAAITVAARDSDGNTVSDAFDVTVSAPPNNAPTVSGAIPDATIVNESGTHETSLSGVFDDGDGDDLTVTASSSDESVATVSVAADYSTLTVSAKSRGTATVTVTASDGNGGVVSDAFTVTVKAAPVVASAIADVSELEVDLTHQVSMSGVFSDPDGDNLTVTEASSSDITVAAVSAAIDGSTSAITAITVTGVSEGTATITVTARDSDGNGVSDAFDVTVSAPAAQQQVNNAPTVSAAIADATIVNETGTHRVALSGVFADADGDALTVTASSSAESVASVAVSADYSTLTVSAKSRGTATVTVTAADGYGGTIEDAFTVTVKAAPVVASAIADVSELTVEATQEVSLAGVFSDADGDALTVIAASSDEAKATVAVAADRSTLTMYGVSEGTVTITVTAQDTDGNTVSDAFDVTVIRAPEPELDPVELPGPVVNLRLTATDNGVIVSWGAPASDSGGEVRGYIVHIRPEGGAEGSGRTKTPKTKKTKVTFENLEAGRTYKVWVRAENEAGKGERVRASLTLPEAEDGQTGQ